jgi:hypothetical protein
MAAPRAYAKEHRRLSRQAVPCSFLGSAQLCFDRIVGKPEQLVLGTVPLNLSGSMVRMKGLEPSHRFRYKHLKLARLPIPPHPHTTH